MNDLHHAIRIATESHQYQLDKCGEPYILHPLRVMLMQKTYKRRILAILHDIIEDTDSTFDFVAKYFTEDIVISLMALTKGDNEKYEDYILRCKADEDAKYVKIADIGDNMAEERLKQLDNETQEQLRNKYNNALKVLLS